MKSSHRNCSFLSSTTFDNSPLISLPLFVRSLPVLRKTSNRLHPEGGRERDATVFGPPLPARMNFAECNIGSLLESTLTEPHGYITRIAATNWTPPTRAPFNPGAPLCLQTEPPEATHRLLRPSRFRLSAVSAVQTANRSRFSSTID